MIKLRRDVGHAVLLYFLHFFFFQDFNSSVTRPDFIYARQFCCAYQALLRGAVHIALCLSQALRASS